MTLDRLRELRYFAVMVNIQSNEVKQFARSLGFSELGIARARRLDEEARRLELWLQNEQHGQMQYMENHFELRVDPTLLLPDCKSVFVLSHNYFPQKEMLTPSSHKIARYAYGKDYHKILKKKLKQLSAYIQAQYGQASIRYFTDSAPILERDWAKHAGIAWTGKNTLSIHPKSGSYFFLSVLLTDLAFEPDPPIKNYCGTCRKCIEACPTQAIAQDGYRLNASKCISYLTIELRDEIPHEFRSKLDQWIFGCDICQEVCPWNRFSRPHDESEFTPIDLLFSLGKKDWMEMQEEEFQTHFKQSPIHRTGLKGMKRNIEFVQD